MKKIQKFSAVRVNGAATEYAKEIIGLDTDGEKFKVAHIGNSNVYVEYSAEDENGEEVVTSYKIPIAELVLFALTAK